MNNKNYTGIAVDPASSIPLHRQLAAAFRDAILAGNLRAGQRLLSSRELQVHLGVSRNTVLNALSQLQAEGYLVTVPGSGTFVARDVDVAPTEAVAQFLKAIPFRPGIPALDRFPVALFRRSLNSLNWGQELLDYPPSWTNERLRNAIVQRVRQTRGVVCSPDNVLVVPGEQYAFSLIAHVLLRGGETAILEDPCCPYVRSNFAEMGARIVPAPVDEDGIDVSSFARRRAKLAFVTPAHQFPTGAVLSLERRVALLEWASKCGAWILEDDYDSEFNYTGTAQPPSLQGLSGADRVVYVGTYSKVLSPSLRVAYVIAPRPLFEELEAAHGTIGGFTSPIVQTALAAFMEQGHFARHVAKMRRVYDERRRFLSVALTSAGLCVRDWGAGMHFVAELPKNRSDAEVSSRASDRGIDVPAVSTYFEDRRARNGLVVGFASTPVSIAREAVKKLVKAL